MTRNLRKKRNSYNQNLGTFEVYHERNAAGDSDQEGIDHPAAAGRRAREVELISERRGSPKIIPSFMGSRVKGRKE